MNSKRRFYLFAGFLIMSFFVFVVFGYFGFNVDNLEIFFLVNAWVAALLYTLLFIVLTAFSFSVSIMTSSGILFFSWPEVVVYSMIGIMGSSIIDFYIARKLGRDYVRNYLERRGGRVERFEEILEKDTFKTTLILSAIFFVPPTIPNFLGGIMNINLKKYSVATFLGNIPNTFFTVYLVNGFFYSNVFQIWVSVVGLILTSGIALFFYRGEIRGILRVSFPRVFGRVEDRV
jgi:uncharacterized membrane protein YdjX (TVP38/TMEM64 family)